jgi:hypothetical protein
MKTRRDEIWVRNVWIAIGQLFTERGPNGGQLWQGRVKIEFAKGFVVTATWVGDEGDVTGQLVDFRCVDEMTFDEATRREEEFAGAISGALHIDGASTHIIATQADVEKEADRCWAA